MQPALAAMIAKVLMDDRLEEAERFRRASRARPASDYEEAYESVTVRRSYPDDGPSVRRLAERDGRRVPPEPMLVAEVGGRLLAARSLENGASVADPRHPTAHLAELLALRSAHLRNALAPSPEVGIARLRRLIHRRSRPARDAARARPRAT